VTPPQALPVLVPGLAPVPAAEASANAGALVDHPSGYLALSPRNRTFGVLGLPGFVAFRRRGRHLFAFGGVHAATDAAAGVVLDAFLREAAARGLRVAAVQVREAQVGLFRSRGFVVNQLGSSFSLDLRGFSMAGTRRMKLRNRIKRARQAGVRVLEVGRDLAAGADVFAELGAVSDAWLRAKRKRELDFMIGELGGAGDAHRRVFIAEGPHPDPARAGRGERALLGFITYVPAWGRRPGWLHDLTRRVPAAPAGVMELINAVAMERLAAEGAAFLHFGFTPFVVDAAPEPGASRALAAAVRLVGRWGGALYPARAQLQYKLKWAPDIVEREYVACKPLSLRAIWDLLRLTRSL
jgi:lysylphosphatidylglycerol synthetase-like protein (DUF2156 family)